MAAATAWGIAVLLMIAGSISAFTADSYAPAFALLSFGLLTTGVAGVLTIRATLEENRRIVLDAYQLGREHGGGEVKRLGRT